MNEVPDRLIKTPEIAFMYGIAANKVSQYVAAGKLPKPVAGWKGDRRWRLSAILRHLDELENAERAQEIAA